MENLNLSTEVGSIYYRYDEEAENFDILRIITMQNTETFKCFRNNDINDIVKIPVKELKTDYQRLLSDAVIGVSNVVVMENANNGRPLRDVVVMCYKRNKNGKFDDVDIVCRQSITDFFDLTGSGELIGVSVSKQTLPENISMEDVLVHDSIIESHLMNVYKNDTLDIINFVLSNKLSNEILTDLFEVRKRYFTNVYVEPDEISEKRVKAEGYNRDLKSLLLSNNFMYDFYSLFGICNVTFEIKFDPNKEKNELPEDQKHILSNLYEVNMIRGIVAPYDYDIDLDLIKMPYILVMDSTNTLYIIVYTAKPGEFIRSEIQINPTDGSASADVQNLLRSAIEYYDKYSPGQNLK